MKQPLGVPYDPNGGRVIAMFGIVIGHVAYSFAKFNSFNFNQADVGVIYAIINQPGLFIFIILAGMVQALGKKKIDGVQEYIKFEQSKFLRIMVPYFSVSLATMVFKLLAPGGVIAANEIPGYLVRLVIAPRGGPSAHLWFLYWLMTVFLIWPFLVRFLTHRKVFIILAVLFITAIMPIPWPKDSAGYSFFGLVDIAYHTFLFIFGYWYGTWSRGRLRRPLLALLCSACIFAGTLILHFTVYLPEGVTGQVLRNIIDLTYRMSGALFYIWLTGIIVLKIPRYRRFISKLAFHSYDIYLLHLAFVTHPIVFVVSKLLHPGRSLTYVLSIPLTIVIIFITYKLAKLIRYFPRVAFFVVGSPIKKRLPSARRG